MADEIVGRRVGQALDKTDGWPVDTVAAAIISPKGVVSDIGDVDKVFELASVTKLLVAYAALVAVEEGAIELDDPAGPEGSTVRHLLAHASGLDFADRDKVRAEPGEKRIYSSAGFEILADHIADATGIPFADYVSEAVCDPLGMANTELYGSAGHEARSTVADLSLFTRELIDPEHVAADTLTEAITEQFPGLDGIVPGYGSQKPCPWGLGFELRDGKFPHWTGSHNSPATFGHFGQSGTFLWVEPELASGLIVLTDRDFGDWAKPLWPELSDAVVGAMSLRYRPEDGLGG